MIWLLEHMFLPWYGRNYVQLQNIFDSYFKKNIRNAWMISKVNIVNLDMNVYSCYINKITFRKYTLLISHELKLLFVSILQVCATDRTKICQHITILIYLMPWWINLYQGLYLEEKLFVQRLGRELFYHVKSKILVSLIKQFKFDFDNCKWWSDRCIYNEVKYAFEKLMEKFIVHFKIVQMKMNLVSNKKLLVLHVVNKF